MRRRALGGLPAADRAFVRHPPACARPARPGTPTSPLPLLSPDVAQPLSGLSECPASSASSGEMKASRSYAVGVGKPAAALSLELSEAGAQSQKPVGWMGWVEAWLNLARRTVATALHCHPMAGVCHCGRCFILTAASHNYSTLQLL